VSELPVGASGKPAIEVAKEAARLAGQILLDRFDQVKEVSFKGRGNIVTDVDVAVEREMLAYLGREFPDVRLMGEESAEGQADDGLVWIVDPLDGTRNYASGIPFYSVVAGLARDGEVLAGVNYDPSRDEMFEAVRGGGAFLNGDAIRVSEKTAIVDCVLGSDMSYNEIGGRNGLEVLQKIWPEMQTVRIMGSAALGISYAAAGRADLYFHHRLEPWDQVAGLLLVEEAGGVVTDRLGLPAGLYSDGLIASNSTLHREFMQTIDGLPWLEPTGRA